VELEHPEGLSGTAGGAGTSAAAVGAGNDERLATMSPTSARSPQCSSFSGWARIILGCGLVVLLGAALAACGQTSSPPKPPGLGHCAKVAPANALRFWARDTLLVSIESVSASPADYPTAADQSRVASLILHAIDLQTSDPHVKAAFADPGDPTKTVTVTVLPVRLLPFGKIAVAVVQIQVKAPSSPPDQVDCVGAVVDTVNYAISTGKLGALDNPGKHVKWLTGASPDFYSMGAPNDYTGGSPSGMPDALADAQPAQAVAGSQLGQMTVFVLDTYDATACPESAQTCAALSGLLAPASPVLDTVKDAGPDETQKPAFCLPAQPTACPIAVTGALATFLQNQGLKDHGRFVAAIIRHLAPKVDLHMIRVLNDSGVGTVAGLIEALNDVYTAKDTQSAVVVNMSLTVVPPPGCLFPMWQAAYAPQNAQNGTQQLLKCQDQDHDPLNTNLGQGGGEFDRGYQRGMLIPLGSVINQLIGGTDTHKYLLVAAAGNDSRGLPTPLGADLPAGYCGVTAVASAPAAVGATWLYSPSPTATPTQLSDFSNAPAVAGQKCVEVGGLTMPTVPPPMPSVNLSAPPGSDTAVVARGEAVCSVFADSPARLSSDSGVAQWKGTSFATAFISGNAARALDAVPHGPPWDDLWSKRGLMPQTPLIESPPCGT
jgi:hypothetical protein